MINNLCLLGYCTFSFLTEMAVAGTTCYYHIARHTFSGHRNCDDRGCCNSNTDNPCCYGDGDNNYYDKLYTSPLSAGAVASIVFGSITGTTILIMVIICICNAIRRNKAENDEETTPNQPTVSCITTTNLHTTHLYGGNLNRAYNCEETHLTYTTCTCSNCSPPPSYNEVMNNTCYQTTNIVHTFTSSPDIVT